MKRFLVCSLLALGACRSKAIEYPPAWELGGQTRAYHEGPLVAAGEEGPERHLPGLIEGWKHGQANPSESGPPPGWVERLPSVEGLQRFWRAGDTDPNGAPVVVQVAGPGPAWDELQRGMRAWTYAVNTQQILGAQSPILVCLGPIEALREVLRADGIQPMAWIQLTDPGSEPTTLFRGPDPMGKVVVEGEAPVPNGLAIVLRLALVDVGLTCRPWRSLERPFEGDRNAWKLAVEGVAFAHLALGTSGLDLSKSDHPELDEAARNQIALWAGIQCLVAPSPSDLNRYLDSIKLELRLRFNQSDEAVTQRWKEWLTGARLWLRTRTFRLTEKGKA